MCVYHILLLSKAKELPTCPEVIPPPPLPPPRIPVLYSPQSQHTSLSLSLSLPINANVPAKCYTSLLHDLKVRRSPSPFRHVRMQNVSPHRPTAPRIAGNAQRPCTRVSCPLRVSLSPLPSLFLPFPCISLVFTALLISFAIARCGQKPYVKFIRIFERF